MKKINILILGTFFTLSPMVAQEKQMAAADKLFNEYSYGDAIQQYKEIAARGYKSPELFRKLGDAYYYNGELEKASKWYGELFTATSEANQEYYYRYAQTLKAAGNYEMANAILDKFAQNKPTDLRAKLYAANTNYLSAIGKNSGRHEVKKTGINSAYSDYGPAYWDNNIVFASARDTTGLVKRVDGWTNHSFTQLYLAQRNPDGTLGTAEKFSKKIDTKYHESTPAFSKDGKTMYFTRNNYLDGKVRKDATGQVLLKIYKATLRDDNWTDVSELPFNSDNYSVAHPALSADGKTLYFASDMPGTYGQADLFKVTINEDGSFGKPENLGITINTQGKETFPFISADNELYFASDGHPGLGGLDIYISKPDKDGFGKALNVGEPVNSRNDDFGYIIDTVTHTGYFASNRAGGNGFDDIYSFRELRQLQYECHQQLAGTITNEKTGKAIEGATVSLFDNAGKLISQTTAGSDGRYSFKVECGAIHIVKSEKTAYKPKEVEAIIPDENGNTTVEIALAPVDEIKVGTDLAKMFKIEQIYFDLAKHNIRPDAAVELDKIVKFMAEYPTAKIDVRTHTDCRASNGYNMALSQNRAKSVINYIISKGIDASRLTGRGYGETKLVNKCSDGVKCSEEEHQQNRRSEFIVVGL